MSLLDNPEAWRLWPPRGGSAAVSGDAAAEPSDTPDLSIGGVASRVLAGVDLGAKTAADTAPQLAALWRHPAAHPLVLILLLLDRYGAEYVDWDPDALKLTLDRDGISVSNATWNKILAGRVVLNSPSPWRQWEVFHWTCRGLAGQTPNFVYFEEPEISHMVMGYEAMKRIDPARPTGLEVDKFVAAAFRHEGIPFIPEPLDFAQRELEQPKIECKNCLALHRDDNDTRCVTCGSTDLHRVPYEFAAEKADCEALWKARHHLPLAQAVDNLPDTGVGNAVYRLLLEWDLAREARAHMVQQLRMIGGK